jgi:hypothetical protein
MGIGVKCKACGGTIPIEDEYVPGMRGAQIAASLYQPVEGRTLVFANTTWQTTLVCESTDCRQTHEYAATDLRLYDD